MKSLAKYLQVESIDSFTYEEIRNLKIGNSIPLKAFLEAARDEYMGVPARIMSRDQFRDLPMYKNLCPNEGEAIILYVNAKKGLSDIRTINDPHNKSDQEIAKELLHTDYNEIFIIEHNSSAIHPEMIGQRMESIADALGCNVVDCISACKDSDHNVICTTRDGSNYKYKILDHTLLTCNYKFTSQELSIIKQYHLDKVKEITHAKGDTDILAHMREGLKHLPEEEAYLVTLTKDSSVKDVILLGKGNYDSAVLSNYEINSMLLDDDVEKALVIHNHPSGNSLPSKQDIDMIKSLQDKAELFNKKVKGYVVARDDYSVCTNEQRLHYKQVKKPSIIIRKKSPQKGMEL